jgi:hypothetical protein
MALGGKRTALVVIPQGTNYFYEVAGHRVAEALTHLDWTVTTTTLGACPAGEYKWSFFINLAEIVFGHGDREAALERVAAIKARSGHTATWCLECVTTRWFAGCHKLFKETGLDLLIDSNLHHQYDQLPPEMKPGYRFVFQGLTETERRIVRSMPPGDEGRIIPWVFVGVGTSDRANLVYQLVKELDPAGFVYMPHLSPVTTNGPHINDTQFQRVLEKARYQVWCAHHPGFYVEGERFRRSLLAGAVPIKVNLSPRDPGLMVPFSYLIWQPHDLGEKLRKLDFEATRWQFIDDYCRLPTLEEALDAFFAEAPSLGGSGPLETGRHKPPAAPCGWNSAWAQTV